MPLQLNLGCGTNKIPGFINIDVEAGCEPDIVCDFIKNPLPYEEETVDRVVFFHCIEHIQRRYHRLILWQIWRVLKPGQELIISFPEFRECFKRWSSNKDGQKIFWEATMFGRQAYPSDFHVVPMDTVDFTQTLLEMGFEDIVSTPEPVPNEFNTVVSCKRGTPYKSYEQLVHEDIQNVVVTRT